MTLLAVLLAVPWSGAAWAHSASDPAATSITITRPAHISVGGPFFLIDQNGRILSDSDFRGTPMLIYFGYTNCPDTCPLDAHTISSVVDILDQSGLEVMPIFISVDPQRDTPARLKEFLAAFHPRFVGLTGSVEAVGKITAAYGAIDDRVRQTAPDSYEVLHPALAYLIARDGEVLDFIHLKDEPELIAKQISKQISDIDHRDQ